MAGVVRKTIALQAQAPGAAPGHLNAVRAVLLEPGLPHLRRCRRVEPGLLRSPEGRADDGDAAGVSLHLSDVAGAPAVADPAVFEAAPGAGRAEMDPAPI